MKPNSFLISIGQRPTEFHDRKATYDNSICRLWLNTTSSNHIQYSEHTNGFHLFIGERSEFLISKYSSNPGQGTFISYNNKTDEFIIDSDELGTAIVYYTDQPDEKFTLISNRIDNLVLDHKPNWNAIQRYLNSGYTILSDTFFLNVKQSLPRQRLSCNLKNVSKLSAAFKDGEDQTPNDSPEVITQKISDRLMTVLEERPTSILMMSAGWDSRTLLVNRNTNYKAAYTHGDLSSREIRIAHSLTSSIRLNHTFVDTQNQEINTSLLDEMLDELGFCVFPIWYLAAQHVKNSYNLPISSGVLGELLGGHYGSLSMGSRYQKLISALFIVHRGLLSEDKVRNTVDRFVAPSDEHWFLSDEAGVLFRSLSSDTKARAYTAIDENRRRSGNWQSAIEQFNMAHRARQYILKQAQAASSKSGYIVPFADDALVNLAKSLPFHFRVHNRTNQRILLDKFPNLLKPSMAATLVSAKYPIVIQELSRGVRVTSEVINSKLGKRAPHLGWFNYEHIYETDTFHEITDSLKSSLWDKARMHETLTNHQRHGIDAGSTLDMLCKIKTVDYYLSLCDTENEEEKQANVSVK